MDINEELTTISANNQTIRNNNMVEVSNIYPSNIIRGYLHAKNRQTISLIRSQAYSICKNKLSMDYIHYAFNKFKRGLVYYAADGNAPFAFCLWKNRNIMGFDMKFSHTEIHVLLICGKGSGFGVVPYILDDLVKICRRDNIQYISLIPANDKLKEYYISCGFILSDNEKYLMLDINKARIKSVNSRRKTRKVRRTLQQH